MRTKRYDTFERIDNVPRDIDSFIRSFQLFRNYLENFDSFAFRWPTIPYTLYELENLSFSPAGRTYM